MQSDGGLCNWNTFSGLKAILSGPAGGVVGYSKTCHDDDKGTALIGCDIGGTRYVDILNENAVDKQYRCIPLRRLSGARL